MMKEENKDMNRKKKPDPFIAYGSTEPVSKEEIEKRQRIIERAEKLGIKVTYLDSEHEYENPYKVEALVYIMNDESVPEDLIKKIEEFEENHKNNCNKKDIKNDTIR